MPVLENELGRRMSAEEVANYLGLDEKTVRQYHRELGGMRLGRLFLFFERSVLNAIQKRAKMDCPSAEERQEAGKGLLDEEGGAHVLQGGMVCPGRCGRRQMMTCLQRR